MKAIYRAEGETIDYTPNAAVAAGDVVVVNGHVRVALRNIAAAALGALAVCGLFNVAKDSSTISDGNALYWNATGDPVGGTAGTGAFTTTAGGNTFAGYAATAAGTSDTTVDLLLVHIPATLTVESTVAAAIADPGASQAIPVTRSGYVPLVTAGAETRTLAAPSFIGQELLLYMKTDGGDCVVTVASAINQTGNNTITFNDVGDTVRLVAVESGASKRWRVGLNDGAALSTV